MNEVRRIRREEMPVILSGSRSPIWWGMVILVIIESTVFATLISSYFYIRVNSPAWPPGGLPNPDLLLPIINTIVLFCSSMAVLWGMAGLKKNDLRRLKIGIGAGIALEIIFFIIKIMMGTGGPFDWSTNAYGSIFFTINWLHTGHVLVAILMASVAEMLAFRGYFDRERKLGVQVVNIYWQFVAVVWIPVFIVLFLTPRWY